jgi:type II secretory pathway component PulF
VKTPEGGGPKPSIWTFDLLDLPGLRWLKRSRRPPGPEPPTFDLLDLTLFRWWVWKWRSLIMANLKVRREAKAVLFGELAEALRQKMPLAEALAANSQTVEESWRRKRHGVGRGADTRHSMWQRLTALIMITLEFGVFWVYTALSFRYADAERVARLMANRLGRLVERGVPLSEAMRRCAHDYDPAEVAIVESAEKWGNMPEALQRLSAYQVTEKTLTAAGASAMYPVILAFALLFPMGFLHTVILPKFKDLFDQLGAELPSLTWALMELSHARSPLALALLAWLLVIVFWIFRALMNGNFMARYILAFGILSLGFGFASLGGASVAVPLVICWLSETSGHGFNDLAFAVIFTALVLLMPYLLSRIEVWILAIERASGRVLPSLPFIGRFVGKAAQTEADSRWLAAVSTALSAGVPAPDALRTAGAIAGRGYRLRSEMAASLVAQGLSIGSACVQARVLEPHLNHRLVLADRSPNYLNALQTIAEDASDNAQEVLYRTGRIADAAGQVMLGVVMAATVLALYLPLFSVPKIVGPAREDARVSPAGAPVAAQQAVASAGRDLPPAAPVHYSRPVRSSNDFPFAMRRV